VNQPTLPFQAHSSTSREAAREARGIAPTARERVFKIIAAYGPITDEGICVWLEMNPSTVRPRRVELQRLGLIHAHGVGLTKAGRKAVTWVAVR
jgi:hypothetical protein